MSDFTPVVSRFDTWRERFTMSARPGHVRELGRARERVTHDVNTAVLDDEQHDRDDDAQPAAGRFAEHRIGQLAGANPPRIGQGFS